VLGFRSFTALHSDGEDVQDEEGHLSGLIGYKLISDVLDETVAQL
jgi:hypothetical protein